MGNVNNTTHQLLDSSYSFVQAKNDNNYGEVKLYSKNGEVDLLALITRSLNDSNQTKKIALLDRRYYSHYS
jgi:hypothetical protein